MATHHASQSSASQEKMNGVQQWPLPKSIGNSRFFDSISGYARAFEASSKRMFSTIHGFELEACVTDLSGCKAEKIRDLRELVVFIKEMDSNGAATAPKGSNSLTRIFFIRQRHSRAEMSISKEAMLLILKRVQVFPDFVNIMSQFQLKTKESHTSISYLSPFYCNSKNDQEISSILEISYTLNHVELNSRSDKNPWSLRQMAVYQKYDFPTKTSDLILIQTSTDVQEKFLELSKDGGLGEFSSSWMQLHEIYLGSLSQNWGAFLQYIDSEVGSIDWYYFTKAHPEAHIVRPTFENIQKLHHWIDVLDAMSRCLQANTDVLLNISEVATGRAELSKTPDSVKHYEHFRHILKTTRTEQTFIKQQVDHVRSFAERRAGQLRDTVALQDSNAMMALNQKTIQEAQTMRTITLVALIYLPASFTATFLGMGYVSVESVSGVMKINVSKDMWFYLVITAPLMFLTFLAWWLWEMKMRKKGRTRGGRDEYYDEKVKDV